MTLKKNATMRATMPSVLPGIGHLRARRTVPAVPP